MPIWLPAPGHREYLNDLSLTSDEKQVFLDWFQGGFQAGDPNHQRDGEPKYKDIEPNLIMPVFSDNGSYLPNQSKKDDYRCFINEWPYDERKYVTAYQARPGNLRVAHHLIAYVIKPGLAEAIRYLEATEPGRGYQCFGGAYPDRLSRESVRAEIEAKFPGTLAQLSTGDYSVGGWAPGTGGRVLPDQTGTLIEPGSLIVTQMHYYSAFAPGESDSGSMTWFKVEDQVLHQGSRTNITDSRWLANGDQNTMWIPPGSRKQFRAEKSLYRYFLDEENFRPEAGKFNTVTIYSSNLHMHSYGASAVGYMMKDGARDVLLEIPRWDLNWQTNFEFKVPLVFTREEAKEIKVGVECEFYNPQDYAIRGGFGSDDEMCFNFMYMVFR